ncbi:TetR family transcriptional regulator [Rhodococcus artemisiae]|uniref:TetR family transcriptional regulator n=1 Tax=Rhodococcus artemisiae TaxID=714159 RepID=A0ABU7L5T6_9NOCA|nr:TetR family transcriptional regulator [Rhodococcus artemisiae]MEE2056920.1 TetR family transcriptional regulator [Rhodococcus artemisiae]
MSKDIRDRGREILTAELADAAATYCAEHGFDAVTVDDIARAIGISRATFFRYFTSKEAAVVAAVRIGRLSIGDQVRRGQPALGTRVVDAVRAAMQPTIDAAHATPGLLRARLTMISESSALRARLASERSEQRVDLEQALLERVADPIEACAAAHASMAAIDLAWSIWSSDERMEFDVALDRAFELVVDVDSVQLDR